MQSSTAGIAFNADFTFDPIGRLSSLFQDATGTANDLTIGQTFNSASQIKSQTRDNDAYAWQGAVPLTRAYTASACHSNDASRRRNLGQAPPTASTSTPPRGRPASAMTPTAISPPTEPTSTNMTSRTGCSKCMPR
jgi:hypothetical protein